MRTRFWTRPILAAGLLLLAACGRQDLYELPDSPYPMLGRLDLPSANEGVAVLGQYAFVAGGEAGLHVVDISDPVNPELMVTVNTTKYAESIEVVRTFRDGQIVDIAHIVEGTEGVTSYDVTDPLNPVDLLQGTTAVDGNRMALILPDDPTQPYTVFLAENWKGIRVFTSNPFVPGVLDYGGVFSSTLGYAKGAAVKDDWLYVADNEMGLVVLDASLLVLGAFGVVEEATVDTPGTALDVAIEGDFAYIADGVEGIHVFDITVRDRPVLTGSLDLPAYSRSLVVRDGLAFLAAATGGVHIVDVSDPTNPTYAGNVPSGYAADLTLTPDGLVLVVDYEDGLYLLSGAAFSDNGWPAPVQGLAGGPFNFTTVELNWYATGDDGLRGRADNYNARWSESPILSEADWNAANEIGGLPQPGLPGSMETLLVGGFTPGQVAYFSVRAWDESGHLSALPLTTNLGTYTGTVLKDASVNPRIGGFQGPFTFEVTYLDENSADPVVRRDLEFDGTLYAMELVSGDVYSGAVYQTQLTEIFPGNHEFRYIFDNGQPEGYVETALDEQVFTTLGITVTLGSPAGQLGREGDEVLTQVSILENLAIAPYEVTQAQWAALMGDTPSEFLGDDLPVHKIDWYRAVEYCNALSTADGFTPAYTIDGHSVEWNREADGWRLPTEAEWEWFARGESFEAFCGGAITETGFGLDPVLDQYGWYGGNADPARPQPVGGKSPNAFGLYDMHGNVAEWCWDWYAAYEEGPLLDPSGPDFGELKVIRGGDWFYQAKACRSASRETFPPGSRDNRVGFRVIRTLIDE